ncbi:MAG: hypothetical protein V7750_14420 [Sneathiella sp.]
MTAQNITVKIGKITVDGPVSRWRLEAAIRQELSSILSTPGLVNQLGQSRNVEQRSISLSPTASTGESTLGPKIAGAVIGALTS